ncbi:hypothetical protein ASG60_08955 [Methylobacterium sp. Leaf469]|uniref:hypothetical protein n=1 Tax=unclassified Methylobacterium TaxID=2615210 RepID=UPI0007019BC9|nr:MULTISPECIES: hypothetical protein [unclassified Methylobacterium]KQO55870.1 hypothetical protein ASF22_10925 [Methylobacterium sp. Leaf87]KQT89797.1 hypothetical protein ASG60_08955 [Methylobacterium sp. Leaf469]
MPFLSRFQSAAAAGCLLALGVPAAAGPTDTACARDVLVASSMQRQAIDQLEQTGSDEAELCRIWRRHVETMRRVAGVYGRCLSGAERSERLAQVVGSEKEFSGLIKSRCKGV